MSRLAKLILTSLLFIIIGGITYAGTIKGTVSVRGLRTPADIVIYVEKVETNLSAIKTPRFLIDQNNLSFHPGITVIPVGATVDFPNNDEVDHNVFSLSRTKKFNLGNYGPGDSKSVVFDQPGLVELRCDMHAEMLAYILVLKNPYYSVTDRNGAFEIKDSTALSAIGMSGVPELPAGTYTVRTWHQKLKSDKQTITVPESGVVSIEFKLTRGTPGKLFKR